MPSVMCVVRYPTDCIFRPVEPLSAFFVETHRNTRNFLSAHFDACAGQRAGLFIHKRPPFMPVRSSRVIAEQLSAEPNTARMGELLRELIQAYEREFGGYGADDFES